MRKKMLRDLLVSGITFIPPRYGEERDIDINATFGVF